MKNSNGKVITFFKRNALYLVLAGCVLAIGLSIVIMLISSQPDNDMGGLDDTPGIETPVDKPDNTDTPVEKPDNTPDVPVVEPIEFIMPVSSATSIGEYSEQMVFNSTLGRFTAHMAIDFYAPEGTDVLAVYGGTVESVESTLLNGTTITINHGGNLKTVYNSLEDGDLVTVGQTVAKGQVIGKVSVSNRQEYKDGAHLHFQVIENGNVIDPVKYLEIAEK